MRRPAPPRDIPPPLELECLKVLWKLGEASVREVRDDLAQSRALAYTTVMTLLERLVRKGGARRRKSGRMFLYSPVLGREQACRAAVQELVDNFFGGSVDQLLAFLQNQRLEAKPSPAPADSGLDATLL